MQNLTIPSLHDFYNARKTVYSYLKPTPLYFNKQMSDDLDADIYIKFENHHSVGAFKVRGGLVRISKMSAAEKSRGVATASTGNHGQSIAFAAKTFGVKAVIFAPEGNNPDKLSAIRNLGAEIVIEGKDFDEARIACEKYAKDNGMVFIHAANEPYLLHGVGTIGLEIFEEMPDIDVYLNPVGGGSSCCSNAIALKSLNPNIEVYAVQAEKAPAVYNSFKAKKMIPHPSSDTFADGLATRVPFEYTFHIMQKMIDDVVLVSEEEMEQAIVKIFDTTHNIAEGAGACTTAAAYRYRELVRGKKVVLLLSGGNLTRSKFSEIATKWQNM